MDVATWPQGAEAAPVPDPVLIVGGPWARCLELQFSHL